MIKLKTLLKFRNICIAYSTYIVRLFSLYEHATEFLKDFCSEDLKDKLKASLHFFVVIIIPIITTNVQYH